MVDVDISKLYLLTKRKSCSTLTSLPTSPTTDKVHPSTTDGGIKLRKSASTLVKHRLSVTDVLFPDKNTSKAAKGPPLSPSTVGHQLDGGSSSAAGVVRGIPPPAAPSQEHGSQLKVDPGDGKGRRGSTVARWFKHITDAADAYKGKDTGRNRKQSGQQTQPPTSSDSQLTDTVSSSSGFNAMVSRSESDKMSHLSYDQDLGDDKDAHNTSGGSVESLETIGQGVEVLHIEAPRLVQPNEVVVSRTICIEKLDPIVTPAEMLNVKCDLISRTLAEKKLLMADILHIPARDYDHIAEMVDEVAEPKEVRELLLSTVTQADLLTQLINERLAVENVVNTHPADDVLVSTDRTHVPDTSVSSSTSGELFISVPGTRLLLISTRLHRSLTMLVEATTRLALENERLRSELGFVQGQLSEIHAHASTEELRSSRSRSNSQSQRDDVTSAEMTTSTVQPTNGDSRPQSFVSVMSSASESNDSSAAERLTMEVNEESDHVICATASLVTVPVVTDRLEIIEALSQPFVVDPSSVIVSSTAVNVVAGDGS